MNNRTASAKAAQPSTPVNFDVPAGACDCHTHIHPDPEKFPFFAGRVYTPELASPEEMTALHKALHMERVVIVTPSIYGTGQLGHAVRHDGAGRDRARGCRDRRQDVGERSRRDGQGRHYAASASISQPAASTIRTSAGRASPAAVERMKARGWHVQLFTIAGDDHRDQGSGHGLAGAGRVRSFRRRAGGLGIEQPGFADLVELVKSGKAYVKISGAYRASKLGPDYADCTPLAQALIAANADRIVWGTDWPHPDSVTPPGKQITDVTPLFQIDDGRLLNQLPVWAPDAAIRKKILVDNPARLYGF